MSSDSEDGNSRESDSDSDVSMSLWMNTQKCTVLMSKESEIPTIWNAFAFLPMFYTVGRQPFEFDPYEETFDDMYALERIVLLHIESRHTIAAAKVLDLTPILVHLLNNSSLEKLKWHAPLHRRASYRVSLLCGALKTNQTLKSLILQGPKPHHDCDLPASRRLIHDVTEDGNTALQELHLCSYDESISLVTVVSTSFNFHEPFKGNGYDWWAGTLRVLNLNTLGRKKLRECTLSVAEFVELLDPEKIMSLVDHSSLFMSLAIDDEDFEEGHLMVDDASQSLEALSNNYDFLREHLDKWIIIMYHDLRVTDLIYGMLREAPGIWCYRKSIKLGSPSKSNKKPKLGH